MSSENEKLYIKKLDIIRSYISLDSQYKIEQVSQNHMEIKQFQHEVFLHLAIIYN